MTLFAFDDALQKDCEIIDDLPTRLTLGRQIQVALMAKLITTNK